MTDSQMTVAASAHVCRPTHTGGLGNPDTLQTFSNNILNPQVNLKPT